MTVPDPECHPLGTLVSHDILQLSDILQYSMDAAFLFFLSHVNKAYRKPGQIGFMALV